MFVIKGYVQNEIGFGGFGFIRGFHGEVEIDIFVREERLIEAGWTRSDFQAGCAVELECKKLPDGRYTTLKLHELDGTLAPALYRTTVVDRHEGFTIVKVVDKSNTAMGYRVLEKNGRSAGSYPNLGAARNSIGKVIEPPIQIGHRVKTNNPDLSRLMRMGSGKQKSA